MWKFRWERHVYNIEQKKHVKVAEGEFVAHSLQGAKAKATRQSGMLHGKWRLTTTPVAIAFKGRVYVKQSPSRPDSENKNPILYLFVLGTRNSTS